VVVARQRYGRTLTLICKKESDAVDWINRIVKNGSTIFADGAHAFDSLSHLYNLLRIHHNVAYSADGACTNWAESFFARVRRAHTGVYHRIGGRNLDLFVAEMAWREDHRKLSLEARTMSILSLVLTPKYGVP
jgi:hypothetical protein